MTEYTNFTDVAADSFTGDVKGDVTGDVKGNVTGNLTGNVTGNLTGNVIGDLEGNVAGDLTGGVKLPTQVLAASGPITIKSGVVLLTKADGAVAATLAAPTPTTDDGKILYIVSTTAQAHTITATTIGFNAADAAGDVATLGAAIGNGLVVVAYQGEWYVLANTNATIA